MKKQRHSRKSPLQQKIALHRINTLFREAAKVFHKDKQLANRYVQLARRISLKYKAKIPQAYKRMLCKNCLCYLVPGATVRIRLRQKYMVHYCLVCKNIMRYVYRARGKQKAKTKDLYTISYLTVVTK